jgi:hypothetical protein
MMATVTQDVKDGSTPNGITESLDGSPSSKTGDSTPVLVIPQPRDGFFGYVEEKTLQHVCSASLSARARNITYGMP